ncbi:hypothetical protein P153DRAFT_384327 [Dothidotthia symphoricarpi CBS 119687]|uniref:Uncharacterized protein n=1 Tax=Dothidotthia symphoricarpi CBS 119687 TaxID=1392245 RepID=A0A6A6AIQ7_9PLEO|nr:uncharacterized protein P153DRAFT_384327 [Dothidotthia symphoricarpi CBS 119687]KAF2131113.1 hypothetical protein P153DRAFT_384327 [Dothidotthia symphoricarpi CBS 119687]
MENQTSSPSTRATSLRPGPNRKRSNSLPNVIQALGCSTVEAELMLAEGRAALRSRRNPRNRSVHDEAVTVFDPRDHMKYLDGFARSEDVQEETSPLPSEVGRSFHNRVPSDTTDRSDSTVVPTPNDDHLSIDSSSVNSLGDYSANLAQFIKTQLKSIPTYKPTQESTSPVWPVSSHSCPDFSFQRRSPPPSPTINTRRTTEAPTVIEIPAVRPPMRSAFSAWSSTGDEEVDEEVDDAVLPLPDSEPFTRDAMSKTSASSTPSILKYYQSSNNRTFLFTSTPMLELKGFITPDVSTRQGPSTEPYSPLHEDDDSYSSSPSSHPQLTSSSAPSFTSSTSNASYFDYKKRPISIAPHMKDRIIAALTPPHHKGQFLTAISPFEGTAFSNVHNVFVESQHRVCVDGTSFDMLRDFTFPSRVTTPC